MWLSVLMIVTSLSSASSTMDKCLSNRYSSYVVYDRLSYVYAQYAQVSKTHVPNMVMNFNSGSVMGVLVVVMDLWGQSVNISMFNPSVIDIIEGE